MQSAVLIMVTIAKWLQKPVARRAALLRTYITNVLFRAIQPTVGRLPAHWVLPARYLAG